MKRNSTLDIVKGICIIMVIITHFSWSDEQRKLLLFPFWIDMAVPLFMVISGYVSSLSLKNNNIQSTKITYSYKMILKKAFRILLPFVLIYIIEIIIEVFLNNSLSTLDIIRGFITGGFGPGSYYTPVMIQFIFVFPILYYIIQKYDKNGIVMVFCVNILYEVFKSTINMPQTIYRLLVFRYLLIIAFGIYFAISSTRFRRVSYILMFTCGFIFILGYFYLGYKPILMTQWTKTSMIAVLYIIPIFKIIIDFVHIKNHILEIIGKSSFHIYLFQMLYYRYIYIYI